LWCFLAFSILTIPGHNPTGFAWKRCLVCDLEDFDFFDLETQRTCQKRSPVQSGVVDVTAAKVIRAIVIL
jgi:hypothetical protein